MKKIFTALLVTLATAATAQGMTMQQMLAMALAAENVGEPALARHFYRQADRAPLQQQQACQTNQSPIPPNMTWVCICDVNGQCRLVLMRR